MAMTRRTFSKTAAAAGLLMGLSTGGGCFKVDKLDSKAKIVIIGGGSAGLSVVARIVSKLPNAKLTIIDPSEKHFYQPGFTFIGAGIWEADEVWQSEADLIPKGVVWERDAVVAVEPDRKLVVTLGGKRLEYDFLVLCPGIQENWSLIKGISKATLGEGNAHSIYDWQGAVKTWQAVDAFANKGGKAIFTDTWTKLKCGGAPKKICLLTEHLMRQRGTRAKGEFKYLTAAKELYDVKHYTPRLEAIYRERKVPITLNARLTGVDLAIKRAYFVDRKSGHTWHEDYDLLHFAPPQSAPDFVRKSGLGWTEGKLAREAWAMVDKETLVHHRYANIVCLGDVAGIPTSKTSAAIRKQAPVAAANLLSLVAGKSPAVKYDGYAACPIITDYGHVLMAEFDYQKRPQPTPPFNWLDTSRELRSAWWLKKYLLKPMYFNLMLRGLA